MTQPCSLPKGSPNFEAVHLGPFDKLNQYTFSHAGLPFEIEGKVFLNDLLKLSSAEVSLNRYPPNTSMPFYHRHEANEEIYIFVRGKGEFQVDGETIPVAEGSVISVAPNGSRCWRSLANDPLHFIVIQAPAGKYNNGVSITDGVAVSGQVTWPSAV